MLRNIVGFARHIESGMGPDIGLGLTLFCGHFLGAIRAAVSTQNTGTNRSLEQGRR